MPKLKKLLTLEQLAQFCEQNKFYTFSSQDTGYTLSVQVPESGYFEAEFDSTRGLLFTKLRVCHTELNRNKSYISEENMQKAMPSLKYRPVLAKIHQLDDGTWDFHAHDMKFIESENEDGEVEIEVEYEEKQIGTFTADDPYLEYNEEHKKTYVMANAVIPEDYTKAADIIRRKNGTKVSCELCINTMSYNAKEKYLELEDFWFSGCTCLGAEKDGTQIGEGMEGSRLDIADFSTANNGMFKNNDHDGKLIEMLEQLNVKIDNLSNFTIQGLSHDKSKEGGNEAVKFKELLEKYSKTEEDITFEIEGLSDEELESKFAEVFGKTVVTLTNDDDNVSDEGTDDTVTQTASEDGADYSDDDDDNDEQNNNTFEEKLVRTYELSHADIRFALYNLLSTFEEADNEWYFINSVYDTHFTYENWSGDKIFGQAYTKDGDNVSFDGERYNLHRELLTDSEYAELQTMRANYSAIVTQLNEYKEKEENAQKDALFTSEDYSSISDKDEFKALEENHAEFSVDELKSKLDAIILDYAKKGNLNFSVNETKPNGMVKLPIQTKAKKSRYGSLFN